MIRQLAAPFALLLLLSPPALVLCSIDSISKAAKPQQHGQASEEFVPLVAFQCGYKNRYVDKEGKWVSDADRYATCLTGTLDILKYCRKVYPRLDITNIMEQPLNQTVEHWCKEADQHQIECERQFAVQPYRCIVGEYRPPALHVPDGCAFHHMPLCYDCECDFPTSWHERAADDCRTMSPAGSAPMRVHSLAMLKPCGLDMYSGVEFVCCPKTDTADGADKKQPAAKPKDYGKKKVAKSGDKKLPAGDDHVPGKELAAYHAALDRLGREHRERIADIVREWAAADTEYVKVKRSYPKYAGAFHAWYTERFRKEVHILIDEMDGRRRRAVLAALERYIGAEEAERCHILEQYRHYVDDNYGDPVDPVQRAEVLRRLRDIDMRINGTVSMLRDFPELETNVKPVAVGYWRDFRRANTPYTQDALATSLGGAGKDEHLLGLYEAEIVGPSAAAGDEERPESTRAPRPAARGGGLRYG